MIESAVLQAGGFEQLAQTLNDVIQGLGVEVLLPIIIFVIALLFHVNWGTAARSSVLIGVGFVGINLVIGLFSDNISPLANQMVETVGVTLPAVDVGWPAGSAIAFGIAELGVWMIPMFVVLNLMLFGIGFTYTINVDIWNYWHFAFIAGLVYFAIDSWVLAALTGLLLGLFVLVVADWFQPAIEEEFDTPGISFPHGLSAVFAVIAIPIYEVLKRVPGLRDVNADPDAVQDRLGLLGEPIFLGVVLGILIGIGANANSLFVAESWYTILGAGIAFAAVMHILPMMVGILMEGLEPLADSIRSYMTTRYEGRDLVIGLDSAILVGHESVIASSLIMVPIAVVMMIVLPGNNVLWGVDLATFPFMFAMMAPLMDNDIVDMVITGTILLIPINYTASVIAPTLTEAAGAAGFDLGGESLITAPLGDAGTPATSLLALPAEAIGTSGAYASLLVGLVITLAIWIALRTWPKRMYMLAGASEEFAEEATLLRHRGKGGGLLPTKFGGPVEIEETTEDVAE
ncbi:MAG: PTS galactitol transporter subunit IIC [Halorhabdus sp.]